jgi:hypothetical protein
MLEEGSTEMEVFEIDDRNLVLITKIVKKIRRSKKEISV